MPVPSSEEIIDEGNIGVSLLGRDVGEDASNKDESPPSHPAVLEFLRTMEDETVARLDYIKRKVPLDCIQPLHPMFNGLLLQDSYPSTLSRLLSPRGEVITWTEETTKPLPGLTKVPENLCHRYLLDTLHVFRHDPSGTLC